MLAAVCLVVAITDGDTLRARCETSPGTYQQITVRLAAVDAPERRQAFGQRAKEALSELCFQQLAPIQQTASDKYGRVVANVVCREKDASRYMVSVGYAWVFDRYAANHRYLYPIQAQAQRGKLGLWRDLGTAAPPVPPWEWRSAKSPSSSPALMD